MIATGLVLNVPEFFTEPAFLAWLNNGKPKFTWHTQQSVPDEYSDVIVCVDPGLTGEGSDSDMPEPQWNFIVEACRAHLGARSGVPHYLVRLTNMAD